MKNITCSWQCVLCVIQATENHLTYTVKSSGTKKAICDVVVYSIKGNNVGNGFLLWEKKKARGMSTEIDMYTSHLTTCLLIGCLGLGPRDTVQTYGLPFLYSSVYLIYKTSMSFCVWYTCTVTFAGFTVLYYSFIFCYT